MSEVSFLRGGEGGMSGLALEFYRPKMTIFDQPRSPYGSPPPRVTTSLPSLPPLKRYTNGKSKQWVLRLPSATYRHSNRCPFEPLREQMILSQRHWRPLLLRIDPPGHLCFISEYAAIQILNQMWETGALWPSMPVVVDNHKICPY